ncbi:GNAT superfamily N-acetyltransferase [Bacillus luteolus]|nr:GNAT superfamily N-acetyltransferase [Cytobacillus luteolus]
MYTKLFGMDDVETKDKVEIQEELENLEFQVYRMQENMKEIAKKWKILGIEQTHDNSWVIIYIMDDGNTCKIMLDDCDTPYRGMWDFSIQAYYSEDNNIHIGDIKGDANKGFGSICMDYLKNLAKNQNIQYITGDIAERDWDHLDRLIHFYEKHNFKVEVDYNDRSGEIKWNSLYQ